jgi:ABC-type dipeptide/oligopeptide/nickel transport system ATPase component
LSLLSVEDLRVEFWTERGTVHAVNGVGFDVAAGETLGIVGESGCGKSVTSLAVMGILPRAGRVKSGRAVFDGRDLLTLRDGDLRRIRGKEIAMIFQDPMTSLNPVLTIGRQIRESLQTHLGLSRRKPSRAPQSSWRRSVSRRRRTGSRTTPTSSRAACGNGR